MDGVDQCGHTGENGTGQSRQSQPPAALLWCMASCRYDVREVRTFIAEEMTSQVFTRVTVIGAK